MKHTKLFLLAILFLASCGAPATPAPISTFTQAPTATQTPTQTPIPTPTLTPTPTQVGGGSGRFIFELTKADFSKSFPDLKGDQNVFIANEDGTGLTPLTNGLNGYNYLESISPDGNKVLISSCSDQSCDNSNLTTLYSIDLNSLDSEPQKLATGLASRNGFWSVAKWIDDTRLVYIGQRENGFGIYIINSDGTNSSNIYKYNNDGVAHKPVGILTINGPRVYWYSEVSWDKNYPWWSSIDGSQQGTLDLKGKQMVFDNLFNPLVFSQDGSVVAWLGRETSFPYNTDLLIASITSIDTANQLGVLSPFPDYKIWPDGSKILVFDQYAVRLQDVQKWDVTSDLFGVYTVGVSPSLPITNEHRANVLDILVPPDTRGYGAHCNSRMGNISPDGRQIIMYLPMSDSDCASKASLLNLETMTFSDILTGFTPLDVQWLSSTEQLTATITKTPIPMATPILSPGAIATAIASSTGTELLHMNLEQPGESPEFTSRGNWITKSVAGNDLLEANSPPTGGSTDASMGFGTSAWANYLLALHFSITECKSIPSQPLACSIIITLRNEGGQAYVLVINAKTGLVFLDFGARDGWKIFNGFIGSQVKLPVGTWHTVLVSVDQDAISASVDGTSTIAVVDDRLTAGPVGIELGAGTTAQFDDINVWSIPSNVP